MDDAAPMQCRASPMTRVVLPLPRRPTLRFSGQVGTRRVGGRHELAAEAFVGQAKKMNRYQLLLLAVLSGCGPAAVPSAPVMNIAPSEQPHPPAEAQATVPRPSADVPVPDPATGTVTGVVRFFGPSSVPRAAPAKCQAFSDVGRPFRVGPDHVAGDVLVGVTNWKGTPPKASDFFALELRDCGASPRTVVLGPGQRLRITNRDPWPYTFMINGDGPTSHTIASGATSDVLETTTPGRYQLTSSDSVIDVPIFAVRYATQAITDINGRYRIERVPVGPAKLSAYIPATDTVVNLNIDVHTGDNDYDVEMR